jgi:XXXCH domain-containing protein
MGEKETKTLNRLELAEYLTNLGEQLRRGVLETRGRQWTIPEDLDFRMEFKEKHGRLVAKLSWSWSSRGDSAPDFRDAASRGPESLKTVKKRLGADFKNLQGVARQGALPDAGTLAAFVASSQAFAALAEPDWQEAMRDYLDHLAELQQAVASRELEGVVDALGALQNCLTACHQKFKSRGRKAQ